MFDIHVHNCAAQKNEQMIEPYFKLFAFMKVNDYQKLRSYESLLQSRRYDTMNFNH